MDKIVDIYDIISGAEYIGLSIGTKSDIVISKLGDPEFIDEFPFSGDKNYIYKDLELFVDHVSECVVGIWIYAKGEDGSFHFPKNISANNFINKKSSVEELMDLLTNKQIKFIIVDENNTKRIRIANGEITFIQDDDKGFIFYSIYLERI